MKSSHVSLVLVMISVITLNLLNCGPKQSSDEQKVARLPDLPQADVDKLKLVPNTHVLATSQVQRRTSPPPATTPPPPCPADATETDYFAQVSYPITVCHAFGQTNEAIAGFYIERQGATSRVANSKLSPELQSVAGVGGLSNAFWVCRTDKGPWQGYLSEQHLCTGTCETLFSLELTNAPNPVVFSWDGSLAIHDFDPNFQFLGPLTPAGPTTDLGSCHTPPPPPPHAR